MDGIREDRKAFVVSEAQEFQAKVTADHYTAKKRLQTLFCECVAEMEKAVGRVRRVNESALEDDKAMIERQRRDRRQQLRWQMFLERLEFETNGSTRGTVLHPVQGAVMSRTNMHRMIEELKQLLITSGPVLKVNEGVQIRSVIGLKALWPSQSDNNNKRRPSLHFGESMEATWSELTSSGEGFPHIVSSRKTQKRRASSAPASRSASTSLNRSQSQSSLVGEQTPLSAAYIRWLLVHHDEILLPASTDIYVLFEEYQAKLNQNDTNTLPAGWIQALKLGSDSSLRIFVRATVAHLLRCKFVSTSFLPSLRSQDVAAFQARYPVLLTSEMTLSHLYIAVQASGCPHHTMYPLDEALLTELCHVYLARPRLRQAKTQTAAISRLWSTFFSTESGDTVQQANKEKSERPILHCVIRNPPRRLIRQLDEAIETFYVEYQVVWEGDTALGQLGQPNQTKTKHTEMLNRLLGQECGWRACLTTVNNNFGKSIQSCSWHTRLSEFIGAEETTHYMPHQRVLRVPSLSADANVDFVKSLVLRSSSLIEELMSHQLTHSIRMFFEFTRQTMSNAAFEQSKNRQQESTDRINDLSAYCDTSAVSTAAIRQTRGGLDAWRTILSTEQQITKTIRTAIALGVLSDSLLTNLEELDSGIRTAKAHLVLELSSKRLTIVQRALDTIPRNPSVSWTDVDALSAASLLETDGEKKRVGTQK
ncbi:hypothetical protein Poli38472_010172 [Pythium oligandrum]|uniref:Uncharacterized protein n=1 Tax=Pythium oligandrum TaxID=41045 RepID=A0A8K1C9F8_PYTOL|nr:hypothetical protein Poli38472_010172 [Pythium oligandrum]|eukprot:TMW58613.1 hypothetical protein Poli38472_010172 [Pythium oligandrum]